MVILLTDSTKSISTVAEWIIDLTRRIKSNYYLNNAVYLAEDIVEVTKPYYGGEVTYGY